MSKELTTKNELSHVDYIDKNLDLIANQNQLNQDDLRNFALQCKRTGLDPITRQIYAIPNNGKMTIMASIDGLRLIAERSGAYEGQSAPMWCGDDGVWKDVWLSKETPKACKVGVYKTKFREPLVAIALFEEYAGKYAYDDNRNGKFKKGDLTFMWAKMPALMIAKVAEALALRKAFPNEMSGIYSTEEMDQASVERNVSSDQVTQKPVNVAAAIEGQKTEAKQSKDLGEFVCNIGKKYKGLKLSEMKDFEIASFSKWLVDQGKEQNKTITGPTLEFIEKADLYLKSIQQNDPKFNEREEIPF